MWRSLLLLAGVLILTPGCAQQHPAALRQAPQAPQEPAGKEAADAVQRKIIYTAEVSIICDDLDQAREKLRGLIETHQGLIAHSEIVGSPGHIRTGTWSVRVPLEQFEKFREAIKQLGQVERDKSDSKDVTEEYYDLEAHIKNRLAEEESLRRLLEKAGDEKIENILAIRRELAQVRDDINRKQGRLKLLDNLTELTTVTITLREKRRFIPDEAPALAETPTFGMRVQKTFADSTQALTDFVQFLLLTVIAVAPWTPFLLIVGLPLVMLVRRRRQRHLVASEPPAEPPA